MRLAPLKLPQATSEDSSAYAALDAAQATLVASLPCVRRRTNNALNKEAQARQKRVGQGSGAQKMLGPYSLTAPRNRPKETVRCKLQVAPGCRNRAFCVQGRMSS